MLLLKSHHRMPALGSLLTLGGVWLHGVLSGTDAAALRPIYALTGLTVSVPVVA